MSNIKSGPFAKRKVIAMFAIIATMILGLINPLSAQALAGWTFTNTTLFYGINSQSFDVTFTTPDSYSSSARLDVSFPGFIPVGSNIASTNWNYVPVAQVQGLTVAADHGVNLGSATARVMDQGGRPLITLLTNTALPTGAKITFTFAAGSVNVETANITFQASDGASNAPSQYPNLDTTNLISIDANGGSGSMSAIPVTAGSATVPTSSLTPPTGCTFAWWNRAADNSGQTQYPGTIYSWSDLTLYAQWFCDLNFDANGGSGSMTAQNSLLPWSFQLSPSTFTRSGYTFAGWNTAANGSGSSFVDEDMNFAFTAGGSQTLYAQWTPLSRTVTFDPNGGTGTMASQSSSSASSLSANGYTRNGYGFTGWNTSANGSGTAYSAGETFPFSSSQSLFAQWRLLPTTPTSIVDIQVPVGSAIANAPVALDIDGLKDQTSYTVTVHSTPQIIDQGTIWSGRLNTTVHIPTGLEAGWHRLVIEGTAADGTPWVETNYFKVSPGGILLATSEAVPAELAMTGSHAEPIFYGAAFLIVIGLGFLAANTTLRRRSKKQQ